MPLKELHFEFVHSNCWQIDVTRRNAGVSLVAKNPYARRGVVHADVLVHAPNASARRRVETDLMDDPRLSGVTPIRTRGATGLFHCRWPSRISIFPAFLRLAPVSIAPVRVTGGREFYSLIGEARQLNGLLRHLRRRGELRLVRLQDLNPGALEKATKDEAGLTDRERDVLTGAAQSGYYDWPRKTRLSGLARRLRVSRVAVSHRLRLAEGKVVRAFVEGNREG